MVNNKRIGLNRKSHLKLGAIIGVLEHDPNADKTPEDNVVTVGAGLDMQAGDIVKIKRKDKTKSPYSVVQGLNHVTKEVEIKPIDAPGSGNRRARRVNYAQQKKGR